MPLSELIKSISDAFVGIAAVVTACVAVYGVKSWARELHGRARFDVARALAKATYRLRDAIRTARTPMILGTEFPEPYKIGSPTDPNSEAEAYAHVFRARWEPLWQAYQDFDAQTLEAEALWGQEIRTSTDELRTLVRKLRAATEAFLSNARSGGEDFRADREFGKQIRGEVFATTADDVNPFTKSVSAAVKKVEEALAPHLRRA